MNNSELTIQIKYINSTPFYRLRHKHHEPLLAYIKTEHKFQTIKLETCKPDHTNLKACPWQLLQTDTDCTKLWGDIKHRCALRQPSTITLLTTKEPLIEENPWLRTQRLGESLKHETHHELFTESVNKIALSANAKTISNPLIGNF